MKILYDYKFGGIIVEVNDNDFNIMLINLRDSADEKELFQKKINSISYQKVTEHAPDRDRTFDDCFYSTINNNINFTNFRLLQTY